MEATCSAVSVSSVTGRIAVRVASRERKTASAIPASASTPSAQRRVPSAWSTSVSGRAAKTARPSPTVSKRTRTRVPSIVAVGEERLALVARDRLELRVALQVVGQRRAHALGAQDPDEHGRLFGQQHAVVGHGHDLAAAGLPGHDLVGGHRRPLIVRFRTWESSELSIWSRSVSRTIQ